MKKKEKKSVSKNNKTYNTCFDAKQQVARTTRYYRELNYNLANIYSEIKINKNIVVHLAEAVWLKSSANEY